MKIKLSPGDFVVDEVVDDSLFSNSGDFAIYKLKKNGLEMLDFLNSFSRRNNINPNDIGFCGIKDKVAVTSQYLSLPKKYNLPKEIIKENFTLTFHTYSEKALRPGDLIGNNFKIKIRDLTAKEAEALLKFSIELSKEGIINYFDSQRFGSIVEDKFVGKFLLEKNFEFAVKYFLLSQIKKHPDYESIKEKLFTIDFKELKLSLPYFNQIQKTYLETKSFKEAYRKFPKKLREIIITTFQSYLWNECVKMKIKNEGEYVSVKYVIGDFYFPKIKTSAQIPTIGRNLDLNSQYLSIIEEVLKKEELEFQLFKSLSKTGSFLISEERKLLVFPKNVKVLKQESKTTKNTYVVELSFFLPKGSYATIFIKELEAKMKA